MKHIFETIGRISAVAAVTLAAVGLYRADSSAQQVVRARVTPTAIVTAPVAPAAPPAPNPVAAPVQTRAPVAVTHTLTPASAALRVRRLVVARSIEDREPQEVATRFTMDANDRLYAFAEVQNNGAPTHVHVRFVPRTAARRSVGLATLEVPTASRWRTWAYSDFVRTPGEWVAVLEADDGTELARTPFVIE